MLRVQVERVRGEVEVFEAGLYRTRVGARGGGDDDGGDDDVQAGERRLTHVIGRLPEPQVVWDQALQRQTPPQLIKEDESLWRIILKLFLGYQFEDEYAGAAGGGEVLIV